jgi:hypothetical protein
VQPINGRITAFAFKNVLFGPSVRPNCKEQLSAAHEENFNWFLKNTLAKANEKHCSLKRNNQ